LLFVTQKLDGHRERLSIITITASKWFKDCCSS
jgi:hypothetical protein